MSLPSCAQCPMAYRPINFLPIHNIAFFLPLGFHLIVPWSPDSFHCLVGVAATAVGLWGYMTRVCFSLRTFSNSMFVVATNANLNWLLHFLQVIYRLLLYLSQNGFRPRVFFLSDLTAPCGTSDLRLMIISNNNVGRPT